MMDLEELAARVVELERRVDTLKAREERLVETIREASELDALDALDVVLRALEGEG